jgi:hypothetical protein
VIRAFLSFGWLPIISHRTGFGGTDSIAKMMATALAASAAGNAGSN